MILPTIHVVLVGLLILEPQLYHGSRNGHWPRPDHLWYPTSFSTVACLSIWAKQGQTKLLHGICNINAKKKTFFSFSEINILRPPYIRLWSGKRETALTPSFDPLNADVFEAREYSRLFGVLVPLFALNYSELAFYHLQP